LLGTAGDAAADPALGGQLEVGVGEGCFGPVGVGLGGGAGLLGRGLGELDGGAPDDGPVLGDGVEPGVGDGVELGDEPLDVLPLVVGDVPEDPGPQCPHRAGGRLPGGWMLTPAPKSRRVSCR
jgi:hypothetical protein